MQPHEIIIVEEPIISCDGGDPALGHPLVYLNMGDKGYCDCPYCGRQFTSKKP